MMVVGGLKVKVIRWRVGQFLLDVLLSDPIKVPTSSPQNQTIRHIFSSSVYISSNHHIIDLFVSFDFVPQDQNVFSFYLAAYIISHLGKFMFLHRINWPRTRCITFQKNGLRWNWNYKTVFLRQQTLQIWVFKRCWKAIEGVYKLKLLFDFFSFLVMKSCNHLDTIRKFQNSSIKKFQPPKNVSFNIVSPRLDHRWWGKLS